MIGSYYVSKQDKLKWKRKQIQIMTNVNVEVDE